MNAVFFDMDGTLFDSKNDLAITVNATRAEIGLPEIPLEDVLPCIGNGARYLLEHAIPERAGDFDALWPLHLKNYKKHMFDTTTLYPGVRTALAALAERGWKLGVNTNKPAFATHALLEHFGIARYFGNAVIAAGDCAEMKPSAMPLRECASRMGGHRLSSHDWMVGDNWTDMACATNAGVKSAFCTFGFGKLKDERCTVKINRFDEILRWCKEEE